MKLPHTDIQSSTAVSPAPRVTRTVSAPADLSGTTELAERLLQNWQTKHPTDTLGNGGVSLDDSLTSLTWLQNLNILKMTSPTPPASPPMATFDPHNRLAKVAGGFFPSPNLQPNMSMGSLFAAHPQKVETRVPLADTSSMCNPTLVGNPDSVDYKTSPYVKPPYSYANLICMAMKETKKQKITLSSIYNWITDNFMYYRMADPSWQNSIRHNLSLSKWFEKVPRRKDEPGKGGFWRLNSEYVDMIENGTFKKRRTSRDTCPMPPTKRVKQHEDDELLVAVNSIRGIKEDKLLSNGSVPYEQDDSDDDSLTLRGDFNWTSVLNQDIEISGVRVKTERIIDSSDADVLIAMSPPLSETTSDDLGLDELFSQTEISANMPLDCTTHDALDLTVTGTCIKPPQWWSENVQNVKEPVNNSGLHTPVHPSSESDDDMWTNATGFDNTGAFDLDNLFDIDNIPSPSML